MTKYWFKRKRYGYGWVPSTWQGWTTLGVYAAVVLGSTLLLDDGSNNSALSVGAYITVVVLGSLVLVYLAHSKGPKAKWRWGKNEDDNPEEDI